MPPRQQLIPRIAVEIAGYVGVRCVEVSGVLLCSTFLENGNGNVRRYRPLLLMLVLLSLFAAGSSLGLYRASQSVPDFYEQALAFDAAKADEAGDELEQKVVELHNELEASPRWELCLSDQQVNGWLATDFVEKFPNLLPPEVKDPRVSFQDNVAHIACRVDSSKVSAVVSLKLEAFLTDQPNQVAVRVSQVRAGVLPVPLTKILDRVSAAAIRSGIDLRWAQQEGDPVAVVALPTERPDVRNDVIVETLQLGEGMLRVGGSAVTADEQVQSARVAEVSTESSRNQH